MASLRNAIMTKDHWVDPKEEVVAILMTQAPGPSRLYYRQLFRQMVQQAIVD